MRCGQWFYEHFVYVTPSPNLARLDRADDRVTRLAKVLGGVFVLGAVATADVAAAEAHP